MRSQLSLPSLSCRREISTIMQVRRCLSRHAPDYLCSKFTARASILTDYPSTCGAKDLLLKAPRTNLYKSSFAYSGAKLYNDLPNELKTMRSDSAFCKAILIVIVVMVCGIVLLPSLSFAVNLQQLQLLFPSVRQTPFYQFVLHGLQLTFACLYCTRNRVYNFCIYMCMQI